MPTYYSFDEVSSEHCLRCFVILFALLLFTLGFLIGNTFSIYPVRLCNGTYITD